MPSIGKNLFQEDRVIMGLITTSATMSQISHRTHGSRMID